MCAYPGERCAQRSAEQLVAHGQRGWSLAHLIYIMSLCRLAVWLMPRRSVSRSPATSERHAHSLPYKPASARTGIRKARRYAHPDFTNISDLSTSDHFAAVHAGGEQAQTCAPLCTGRTGQGRAGRGRTSLAIGAQSRLVHYERWRSTAVDCSLPQCNVRNCVPSPGPTPQHSTPTSPCRYL